MNEVHGEILHALANGERIAVATVANARGSTPRRPGAKMVVRADGSFCGTIGGGCGESEVRLAAVDVLQDARPRVVTVDLTNPLDGPDKICGGVMEVFVECLGA